MVLVETRDLKREPVVIAVSDGHRTDKLLCMAILSRARLEAQGETAAGGRHDLGDAEPRFGRAGTTTLVPDLNGLVQVGFVIVAQAPCRHRAPSSREYR